MLWKKLSQTTWTERFFLFFSLVMAIGFIHFDAKEIRFAKYGFDLQVSSGLGGIHNQAPKLFVTEIYILILFALTLANWNFSKWQLLLSSAAIKKLIFLIFIFFSFGMLRTFSDLRLNPILGIRNSAFVWYLCIPIFIWLMPIRSAILETLFWIIQVVAFLHFTISNAEIVLLEPFILFWFPCIGLIAPMSYALLTTKKSVAVAILVIISAALAMSAMLGFQRTTLLGMIIGTIGIFLLHRDQCVLLLKRIAFVVVCTAVIFIAFRFGSMLKQNFRHLNGGPLTKAFLYQPNGDPLSMALFFQAANPLNKAEANGKGLEIFRAQLWEDAWHLFTTHPLLGIGFQNQVVYRAYAGAGNYVANDGNFEQPSLPQLKKSAPISGPHNSYLNAIARMGIIGSLILIIHLILLQTLFSRRKWAGFFLLLQGMLYAFFNIGLEGPTRSFFLLLAMGLALKLISNEPMPHE